MYDLSLSEIWKASKRLAPILHHTELDYSATFSAMTGGDIYLKCENHQKTGSFKIRGASNKIACMVERVCRLGRFRMTAAAVGGSSNRRRKAYTFYIERN